MRKVFPGFIRDLSSPIDLQRLLDVLNDLYGYVSWKVNEATVLTTDATLTTILTLPLVDNATSQVSVDVVGKRTGGASGTAGDGAGYRRLGTFFRVAAGNATQIGATSSPHTAESQAAWDCSLAVSGTTVLVQVTGAAGNNITWDAVAVVQQV